MIFIHSALRHLTSAGVDAMISERNGWEWRVLLK